VRARRTFRAASRRSPSVELGREPRAGETPFAVDRAGGGVEHARDLVDGEAAEETQLDELRLELALLREPRERFVESEDVERVEARRDGVAVGIGTRVRRCAWGAADSHGRV